SPATVTVTFTAADKTYDGNNTAAVSNCVIATGKVGSDDVTCSVAGGTFASSNASASAQTVSATATLGGTKAGNYTVANPVTTTAKINPAPLTITAVTNTKIYDGNTNAAATPTVVGLMGSDTVTGRAETYDNKNVGVNKTLSVSAYTVNDGNGGGNYTVKTNTNTTGVVNQASTSITASVTPNSAQYSDKVDLSAAVGAVPATSGSVSFYINSGTATQQLL